MALIDQQGPRRHQAQDVAFLGEAQGPGQHLADAAGRMQVRLVVADGADRHHGPETLVEGAGVHGLVAAAGRAGDAQAVAGHLGPGQQVIDGPAVVVDLHAQQRVADRPERAAVQGAVVGAAGRLGVALAGAEGIHGQHEEAELHQPQAARLHHGIAPCPGPVAMHHQHRRHLALHRLRHVGAGRHPDVRPALEDEFLDAVALPLQDAEDLAHSSGQGFSGNGPMAANIAWRSFGAAAATPARGAGGLSSACRAAAWARMRLLERPRGRDRWSAVSGHVVHSHEVVRRSRTRARRASLTSGGTNLSSSPPNVAICRSSVLLMCEYVFLGHQEHRLDLRVEGQVRQRHGELVFHVAGGAQAAEHDAGPDLADEVHRQACEGPHLHVGKRRDHALHQLHALLQREERRLLGIVPTPTTRRSKIRLPRWMTSRWPRWTGSKTPV